MKMPEVCCCCKNCGCNNVCEFYEVAIQPVIKVIEDESHDLNDYITKTYLNKLKVIIEEFYCDQRE